MILLEDLIWQCLADDEATSDTRFAKLAAAASVAFHNFRTAQQDTSDPSALAKELVSRLKELCLTSTEYPDPKDQEYPSDEAERLLAMIMHCDSAFRFSNHDPNAVDRLRSAIRHNSAQIPDIRAAGLSEDEPS